MMLFTVVNTGAYVVTNSFSWGTIDDYTVVLEQYVADDEAVD